MKVDYRMHDVITNPTWQTAADAKISVKYNPIFTNFGTKNQTTTAVTV